MRHDVSGLAMLLVAIVLAQPTEAVTFTIDFSNMPGPGVPLPAYTEQGVTFTATNGDTVQSHVLVGRLGIIGTTNFFTPSIRADIAGGAQAVSILIGDAGADEDAIFLSAFDSGDVLLDTDSGLIPAFSDEFMSLSVTAPNIAYVTFGNSTTNSDVITDEITITRGESAAVPEPATASISLLAVAGWMCAGRRLRRRT